MPRKLKPVYLSGTTVLPDPSAAAAVDRGEVAPGPPVLRNAAVLVCLGEENRNFFSPRLALVVKWLHVHCDSATIYVADTLFRWNLAFRCRKLGTPSAADENSGQPAEALDATGKVEVAAQLGDLCQDPPPGPLTDLLARCMGTSERNLMFLRYALDMGSKKKELITRTVEHVRSTVPGRSKDIRVATFSETMTARAAHISDVCPAVLRELHSPESPLAGFIREEVNAYRATRVNSLQDEPATGGEEGRECADETTGPEVDCAPAHPPLPPAAAPAQDEEDERHFSHCGEMYNAEELAFVETVMRGAAHDGLMYPGRLLKYPEVLRSEFSFLKAFTAKKEVQLVGLGFSHGGVGAWDRIDV